MGVSYMSKAGIYAYRGFEIWTDKDGDKVVWELSRLGNWACRCFGWQGKDGGGDWQV